MAALYIVSTPIGNLGDVTYRAVQVLGAVHRVLAEDTRRTGILLRHYGVSTPRVSLHEHNEAARTESVLAWLAAGEDLALVSDAGTPLLSDPGARVVRAVLDAGHDVVPVPGASALLAALVASGLEPQPFAFLGFAPRSGGERAAWLERVSGAGMTTILYESPNRLVQLLRDLAERCGDERSVAVGRELTKLHETFVRGTLAEAIAYYENTPARGEVVVVLAGGAAPAPPEAVDARVLADALLAEGRRPSAVARELTARLGMPRNEAYALALAVAGGGGEPR